MIQGPGVLMSWLPAPMPAASPARRRSPADAPVYGVHAAASR